LALKSEIEFLSTTVKGLILNENPPRLQALLRMTESRVKAINAGKTHEEDLDKVANELISVSEVLSQMMND